MIPTKRNLMISPMFRDPFLLGALILAAAALPACGQVFPPSGGGGGGGGSPAYSTFSGTTPTYDASAATGNIYFSGTLAASVTGGTLTLPASGTGQEIYFRVTEGGSGGYGWVCPTNATGCPAALSDTTLNAVIEIKTVYDGTAARFSSMRVVYSEALGCVKLLEALANGSNFLSLCANAAMAADIALTPPQVAGALVAEPTIQAGTLLYAAGGGTAQAQTLTLSPAVGALTTGMRVCWLPAAANTAAAPTLAINGLTAKPITKFGTTALVANDITTAADACAIYDGTEFQLQNPQTNTGSGGSNTCRDVYQPLNPACYYLIDDFTGLASATSFAKNWHITAVAGTCATPTGKDSVQRNVGIKTNSGATDNCQAFIDGLGVALGQNVQCQSFGSGSAFSHWKLSLRFIVAATSTANAKFQFGCSSSQTFSGGNTIAVSFSSASQTCNSGDAHSTANMMFVVAASGTTECHTFGVAPANDGEYEVIIEGSTAGTLTAKLRTCTGVILCTASYGSTVTASTSVPTGGMMPMMRAIGTAAANAVGLYGSELALAIE